jgi:FixJ family two-component response regulator
MDALPIPPKPSDLAALTDSELRGLAGAVRGEQNRRHAAKMGVEERRARTAKARGAKRAERTVEQKRAQTAAATAARRKSKRPN